jgi:hypothetical protein
MAAELKIHRGCTIDHMRSQCMGKPAPVIPYHTIPYRGFQLEQLNQINYSSAASISLTESRREYSRDGTILTKPRNTKSEVKEVGITVTQRNVGVRYLDEKERTFGGMRFGARGLGISKQKWILGRWYVVGI